MLTLHVRCPLDAPEAGAAAAGQPPPPAPRAAFPCSRHVRLHVDLLALDPGGLRLLRDDRVPRQRHVAAAAAEVQHRPQTEPPTGDAILHAAARALAQVTGAASGPEASAGAQDAMPALGGAAGSAAMDVKAGGRSGRSAGAALEGLHVSARLPLQLQYGGSALDAHRVWAMMDG